MRFLQKQDQHLKIRQSFRPSSGRPSSGAWNIPRTWLGRIMQTDFIAVPPFWLVGQTIDYMRDAEDLPDRFDEVFVVHPSFHLIGSVALDRLLRSKRPINIEEITESEISSCCGRLGPGRGGAHLRALQSRPLLRWSIPTKGCSASSPPTTWSRPSRKRHRRRSRALAASPASPCSDPEKMQLNERRQAEPCIA